MKTLTCTFVLVAFACNVISQTVEFKLKSQSFPKVINGAAAWGDINNDGYYDLAICGNTGPNDVPTLVLKVFKNNKDTTFTEVTSSFTGMYEGELKWADFNNDGWLDLLACGAISFDATFSEYTPGIKLYKNNGDETFTDVSNTGLPAVALSSVDVADIDKDGKIDIAISGLDENGLDVSKIYKNNGDFKFESATTLDGLHHSRLKFGDYNNDGYADLILSGFVSSSQPKTYLYQNNRILGMFSLVANSMAAVAYGDICWADFNNDGLDDIVFSGSFGGTSKKIYQNNYPDAFTDVTDADLLAAFHSTVDVNDFDLDGDIDIMIIGSNGSVAKTELYVNDGSFNFSKDAFIFPGAVHPLFASADINNDGKIDFVMSGPPTDNGTKETYLYINNSQNTNTAPSVPTNLKYSQPDEWVVLSWDKATDSQGNSNTITYNVYIGTSPGSKDVLDPSANLQTGSLYMLSQGNNQHKDSLAILLDFGFYYWGVQAIDNNFMASSFSTEMPINVALVSMGKKEMSPFTIYYNSKAKAINLNCIEPGNSKVLLEICDVYGKIICRKKVSRKSETIETNGWAKGIYIVRINNLYSKVLLVE